MKIYQIVSFMLDDGCVVDVKIIKLFHEFDTAVTYLNTIVEHKLFGSDYEASFSYNNTSLYTCAENCKDDYGEPDVTYYNIIKLEVSEEIVY